MSENKLELLILKTDEDMNGYDISKMSNFLDDYVSTSISKIRTQNFECVHKVIDNGNISIIKDVVQGTSKIINKETVLIPDFDSLPSKVKINLKKGIYNIAESRQVDGNLRPVIVDQNGVRIKDITLRKVLQNNDVVQESTNIYNQLELKAINEKIEDLRELQLFQIERDRKSDIVAPFYNARDHLKRAQNETNIEKRKILLEKVIDYLIESFNQARTDIEEAKKQLINLSSEAFKKQENIQIFINYITEDFHILTMITGLQMQIFEYIDKLNDSKDVLKRYESILEDFSNNKNNKWGMTPFELIHDNCLYNENNRDSWYYFSKNVMESISLKEKQITCNDIYLISLEDPKDE